MLQAIVFGLQVDVEDLCPHCQIFRRLLLLTTVFFCCRVSPHLCVSSSSRRLRSERMMLLTVPLFVVRFPQFGSEKSHALASLLCWSLATYFLLCDLENSKAKRDGVGV